MVGDRYILGKDKNESGYFMKPWATRCVLHASEESIVTSKALGRRPTVYTHSDPKSIILFGNSTISQYFQNFFYQKIWQFSDLKPDNYFSKTYLTYF